MALDIKRGSWYRVQFLILLGLLILGHFGKVHVTPNVSVYLHEGWLLVMLASSMFVWKHKVISSIRKHELVQLFSWFILVVVGTLVIAIARDGVLFAHIGVAYFLRLMLYASFFPVLTLGLEHRYIRKKDLIRGIIAVGAGLSVLGLVQFFWFPDMRFLYVLGYDDHYYRLVSTLFDPPFTGAIFSIALLLWSPTTWKQRLMWALVFVSLLLTYSRASYLGFACGLLTLTIIRRKVVPLFILGVMLLSLPFLPRPASEGTRLERTISIEARLGAYQEVQSSLDLNTILFGKGWYLAQAERNAVYAELPSHSSSLDNSYLHVFISTGIVGLLLFTQFILKAFKLSLKSPAIAASFVALAVSTIFNNLLFYPWIMVCWISLLAVLVSDQTT